MRFKQSYNAFTLIELLVVVSVIALLLAILVPVLNRARDQGRVIVCSAILRNLFTVQYSYFAEYTYVMPPARDYAKAGPASAGDCGAGRTQDISFLPPSVQDPVMRPWFTFDYVRTHLGLSRLDAEYKKRLYPEQIQEYKPSYPKSFICPAAKYALQHSEDGLYPIDRAYGVNVHPYYSPEMMRDKLLQQTGRHICLADAMDWWFNYYECDKYVTYGEVWLGFDTYGMAAFRHFGKANCVYWDGHCERIRPDELKKTLRFWVDFIGR
jgi:prepilin-type N-terminal cleavage/methylation domain-containing protein/prepilin-type processing-associated H-X9-DG protein